VSVYHDVKMTKQLAIVVTTCLGSTDVIECLYDDGCK